MRRLLIVGLHAFQFKRPHHAGLSLNFLLETVQQLSLINDYRVQLFDLMLKMSKVRFQLVQAMRVFIRHPWILYP